MSTTRKVAGGTAVYVDDRLRSAAFVRRSLNKVFPDHWSFMLGEIALYSFIVLLLTGTWLTFFFKPSMGEVIYNGSYVPLRGVEMSEAYASTLEISWDIRGGLVMRQIHHWAALLFVAAIMVHLCRVFFTGGFRKPREFNWLLGIGLLVLAIAEGFLGYGLPDDLLSGIGLRITQGIVLATPVLGTYMSFFAFGGEFPGDDFVPRMYVLHILLIPAILLALIAAHVGLVWYQKHTQYPLPGRKERNVVGYPFFPHYMAKAGGFFFIVFAATALLGGFAQINPVWLYGPYSPSEITAGSQPDWYMGPAEGIVRLFPNWEIAAFGHTLSLNLLIPAMIVLPLLIVLVAIYPFLEHWVTGDHREHHILDRPRNQPTRTGLGVGYIVLVVVLFIAAGNDVLATTFNLSIQSITWALRILFFVAPPIAFIVTKRICLSLQRRDRDLLLHGRETGIIRRTADGEVFEVHQPVDDEKRITLLGHEDQRPAELPPAYDENGVPRPGGRLNKLRMRLSNFYYRDRVEKPTRAELDHAAHHQEELAQSTAEELPGGGTASEYTGQQQ
jgi:ubiquinol-cytochrome c reductase cytochrome b subunit